MTKPAITSLRGKIEKRLDEIVTNHYSDESYHQLLRIYHELALGPNLTRSIEDEISTLPLLLGTGKPEDLMNSVLAVKRPSKLSKKIQDEYQEAARLFYYLAALPPRNAEEGGPRYVQAVWITQSAFGFNIDLTIGQVIEAGYALGLRSSTYDLPAACLLARPPGAALFAAKPHGDLIFEIAAERESEQDPLAYHLRTKAVTETKRFPSTTTWAFWREIPKVV